jgi:hypothetical protein
MVEEAADGRRAAVVAAKRRARKAIVEAGNEMV